MVGEGDETALPLALSSFGVAVPEPGFSFESGAADRAADVLVLAGPGFAAGVNLLLLSEVPLFRGGEDGGAPVLAEGADADPAGELSGPPPPAVAAGDAPAGPDAATEERPPEGHHCLRPRP